MFSILLAFLFLAIAIPAYYKALMALHEWAEKPITNKIRKANWLVRKWNKEVKKWKIRRLNRLKQEHEASINELNERLEKENSYGKWERKYGH